MSKASRGSELGGKQRLKGEIKEGKRPHKCDGGGGNKLKRRKKNQEKNSHVLNPGMNIKFIHGKISCQ